MADIIQYRRDTLAQWNAVDPILAEGEMGYEIDTNKLKVGNATDVWSALPYFGNAGITDHTLLSNIGTNSHDQIDTAIAGYLSHAANSSIHFTQAAISISASQVSDFDIEVSNNVSVSVNTSKVGITTQQASDITANNAKVSNVAHPLVETAVPVGALFTDTVYIDTDVLKDADALSPVTGINKIITQDDLGALGGGDVTKVGTPVSTQVGLWTGDGTLQGSTGLTYDGSNLGLLGTITASAGMISNGGFAVNQVGESLSFTTTEALGGTYQAWKDGGGLKGFLGYASLTDDDIYFTNNESASIRFGTSTRTNDLVLDSAGNLAGVGTFTASNLSNTNTGDVTLTTTGTSGAATLVGQVLNIPNYAGGGGGAVDSVNGEVGVVVLDTDDIDEGSTNLYYTDARVSNLALKSNVLELDNTDAFTPTADYEPATKKYADDNVGIINLTIDTVAPVTPAIGDFWADTN